MRIQRKLSAVFASLFAVGAMFSMSSCQVMEPKEKPIRPVSENSNIAHGASQSSGEGALGGIGAFSR